MALLNNARVGGLLFLAVSLLYGYFSQDIPLDFWAEQEAFNARSMPQIITVCGIVTSLTLLVLPSEPADWSWIATLRWRPAALLLALMSAYGVALEPLGFGFATALFLIIATAILGERRWWVMLAASVALTAGFWLLMDQLGIYLAPGYWLEDLLAVPDA